MTSSSAPPIHQLLLELSSAALLVVDERGLVIFATPAAARLFGHDLKGLAWASLAAPESMPAMRGYLGALARSDSAGSMFASAEFRHVDGRALWLEIQGTNLLPHPQVAGLVLVLTDATQHRQQIDELRRVAVTDALTGLHNRTYFVRHLETMRLQSEDCVAGFVDLDQFKRVNDGHGHAAGDRLLQAFAQRMVEVLPAEAVICRTGGDEFAFAIAGSLTPALSDAIESLRSIVVEPESADAAALSIGASIGVTQAGLRDVDTVIGEADVAVYVAKIRGRGQIAVYSADAAREFDVYRSGVRELGQLVESNRRLHAEARTDALTGLANRRALEEVEDLVVGNPGCRWARCAVLFVDVDHFGRYNKLYGDRAGDLALRAIGRRLQSSAREADLVYRKGGEEFVLVLPHTDLDVALAVAQRIRSNIRELGIEHADGEPDKLISVLVSVAIVPAGDPVGAAVAAAGDEAMRAKNAGRRDRIVACA